MPNPYPNNNIKDILGVLDAPVSRDATSIYSFKITFHCILSIEYFIDVLYCRNSNDRFNDLRSILYSLNDLIYLSRNTMNGSAQRLKLNSIDSHSY